MQVKMGDFLTAVLAAIDDTAKAAFVNTQLSRDLGCRQQQTTQYLLIFRTGIRDFRDDPLGHNQHMNGRCRMNIPEGAIIIVVIYYISGDLARYYSGK